MNNNTAHIISDESFSTYIANSIGSHYNGLTIFMADQGMHLPSGQHSHDLYEFLMPLSGDFNILVDGKNVTIPISRIFPINPRQHHGVRCDMKEVKLLSIKVDKEYMGEISRTIYGSPEILFENDSFEIQKEILTPVKAFIHETKLRQAGYEFIVKGLQYQIIVNLIRHIKNNMQNDSKNVLLHEKRSVLNAVRYMKENYDCELSLDTVAKVAGFSKYHFIRIFKTYTNKTPNEFLIDLKIGKAKHMLNHSKTSITDICYLCGFNNLSHFTNSFKKRVGAAPSEYRKSQLWCN